MKFFLSFKNDYLCNALVHEKNEVAGHLIETAFESPKDHHLAKEADHFAKISEILVHLV